MKRTILLLAVLLPLSAVFAQGDWQIIKARGDYGIANKGSNQGVRIGQKLYLQRIVAKKAATVGSVKVIRVTANRAAVEKINAAGGTEIQVGDQLALPAENPLTVPEPVVSRQPLPSHQSQITPATREPEAVVPPQQPDPIEYKKTYEPEPQRKPWIAVNAGTTIPASGFASNYKASPVIGASYMVPLQNGLHIGLEINQSFINNSNGAADINGSSELSSTILEGLVVGQKFFGDYFFLEAGGGLYRPRVKIASVDGTKSNYSSTDFGLFGGTGLFVPTSSYAGFSLRARLHNYFDRSNHTYVGFSGGFRFKME